MDAAIAAAADAADRWGETRIEERAQRLTALASGFGRALGDAGVYEFVNITTEVRAWS
ncbi:MAG TPA: hypothetical protein VJ853_02950 [Thermoanaerobaculia bacterium]|nr:hypothetical protein [Thermoanaerobaculia bacterium]